MMGELWGAAAAGIAALTSFVLGILTHRRANKVHKDELEVDHAKMIQSAYQEILDEMRGELDRRKVSEEDLRKRVVELESELIKETSLRQKLERKLSVLDGKLRELEQQMEDPEEAAEEKVQEHEEEHHE